MLLNQAHGHVMIIDVQERLVPAMHESERMVERCAVLMQAAARLGLPVTVSEQYRKGLGATVPRLDTVKGDAAVIEKLHFSCAADPALAARARELAAAGRRQIVIGGIESHVCVLQTALGFKAVGLDVFVVEDAVTSRAPASIATALERLRAAGVCVVNTEMVLFEWLHKAGTPEFKDISKLIR